MTGKTLLKETAEPMFILITMAETKLVVMKC